MSGEIRWGPTRTCMPSGSSAGHNELLIVCLSRTVITCIPLTLTKFRAFRHGTLGPLDWFFFFLRVSSQLVHSRQTSSSMGGDSNGVGSDGPATRLRKRKSNSNMQSDNIANGHSTALLKLDGVPTEHGREMDKKLDVHQS